MFQGFCITTGWAEQYFWYCARLLYKNNLISATLMQYKDLRDFIAQLESQGELKRISIEINPILEMTEICDRLLKKAVLLFYLKTKRAHHPCIGKLIWHS